MGDLRDVSCANIPRTAKIEVVDGYNDIMELSMTEVGKLNPYHIMLWDPIFIRPWPLHLNALSFAETVPLPAVVIAPVVDVWSDAVGRPRAADG